MANDEQSRAASERRLDLRDKTFADMLYSHIFAETKDAELSEILLEQELHSATAALGHKPSIAASRDDELKLRTDRHRLLELLVEKQKEINTAHAEGQSNEERIRQLEEDKQNIKNEYNNKSELLDLFNAVEEEAKERLLNDSGFATQFAGEQKAYITSVDMRRSTELMMRASHPAHFADFITRLCDEFRDIVWRHHGVFDKFTGDGILAFFPELFSGPDAGYLTLSAADACHASFSEIYRQHRYCFETVPLDVGLGIGIDYGAVHVVRQWGGLTVVGKPVVYACRLGGGPAGRTLLNHRAYNDGLKKYENFCEFEEFEIEIKHEGRLLAHSARLREKRYQPRLPAWLEIDTDKPATPEANDGHP